MKVRNVTNEPWYVAHDGLVKVEPGGVADFPDEVAQELCEQMDGLRFALADKAPEKKDA